MRRTLTQRFVDASIEGWYDYLYGDFSKTHELIQQENPELSTAFLNFSRQQMIKF